MWLLVLIGIAVWIGYSMTSGTVSIATIAGVIAFGVVTVLFFRKGKKNAKDKSARSDNTDSVHAVVASVSDSSGPTESEQGAVYRAVGVAVDDVRPEPDEPEADSESPAGDQDWVSTLLPGSAGGSEAGSPIYDELDSIPRSDLRHRRRLDGASDTQLSWDFGPEGDLHKPGKLRKEDRPTLSPYL